MFADLVLEGGGVKGIALVGAISVLEERGYEFRRVAGTSAGAIVGSLVAAGARAAELEEIMRGVQYRRFADGPRWRSLLLGKAVAVLSGQGIYDGQFARDWLGGQLARLGVRTFADLRYADPGRPPDPDRAYRLVVMTCDLSQGCLRRLPWDYGRYGLAPAGQPVADAVRASMSIPFFYKPARLTDAGGRDRWLVDGAMVSRFPIDVFDAPPAREPRWPTFGIKLGAAPGPVTEIHGTASMSRALLNAAAGFCDRRHVEDAAVAARTIVVDTGTVRATDFDLDRDAQDLLFRQGRQAALTFLDGTPGQPAWDWQAYKRTYRGASPRHPRSHASQQRQASPDTPSPRTGPRTGSRTKRHCQHARGDVWPVVPSH